MAYTTINKSTDYFNTKLYTGNNTSQAITGVGFQPDWVWIKSRTDTNSHNSWDSVRGVNKYLENDTTKVETTDSNGLTAFGTDGFTVGSRDAINDNSVNFASWNWKANGAGSSNSDGSITSTVSANTTAGFSIVKYSGTGSNGTVGHGLGVAPKIVLVKNLGQTTDWYMYTEMTGNTHSMLLNSNSAKVGPYSDNWNNTSPTTTTFSVGTSGAINSSIADHIAYCFAEKTGYSKMGSYVGNNNADGPFVYTGFKPALIFFKNIEASENWLMFDNRRIGYNSGNYHLFPNASNVENTGTGNYVDMLSNGFKIRVATNSINVSQNQIYMAFGQSLVGSNNVPCTAR